MMRRCCWRRNAASRPRDLASLIDNAVGIVDPRGADANDDPQDRSDCRVCSARGVQRSHPAGARLACARGDLAERDLAERRAPAGEHRRRARRGRGPRLRVDAPAPRPEPRRDRSGDHLSRRRGAPRGNASRADRGRDLGTSPALRGSCACSSTERRPPISRSAPRSPARATASKRARRIASGERFPCFRHDRGPLTGGPER
jgi:hypothetical protein